MPADYVQLNPQVSVDTGGNRDLQPETSETFTAGFTWDIPLSGGVSSACCSRPTTTTSTIDGAIQAPDAQDTLDACIATLDPLFCNQVNRSPSGTITSIEGTLNNIGGIETDGFDINFDLAPGGVGRRIVPVPADGLVPDGLRRAVRELAGGFDRVDRAGQELGSPTRGFVEDKVDAQHVLGARRLLGACCRCAT